MEEKLPRRIAWFAPWTWSLWLRIPLAVLLVMGVIGSLLLIVLSILKVDIFITDTTFISFG